MTIAGTASDSIKILDVQLDSRVNCWSVLASMNVESYLKIADEAYLNRGGIKHQRDALKTTSARRIRSRLVQDIKKGAIIPPVVIGIVLPNDESFDKDTNAKQLIELLLKHKSSLSIIDGMQRTTALQEALSEVDISKQIIRIEIWIAVSADSLIYRMLVLNTGQIPWNLKQQLNVVFEPIIQAIERKVNFARNLKRKDGNIERRSNGGEFAAEDLVEAYIAFGLRRTEVDTQEHLADEFSRLDMADALTSKKYDRYFYPVLQLMVDFDVAISRFNPESIEDTGRSAKKTYTRGKNILDSQPPRIAFVVAAAISILGRISMDKTEEDSIKKLEICQKKMLGFTNRLREMNSDELGGFLALGVLSEVLARRPSSAVGRWERNFFEHSFKVLFDENFEVPTLETCWRG